MHEARTSPLAGVAVQRELAHDQDVPSHVGERKVHLPRVVGKDAKPQDLLGHPDQSLFLVARREAHEQQVAASDAAGLASVDRDASARDTLEDDPHSTVTDLARFLG